jgi:hypothetical protein
LQGGQRQPKGRSLCTADNLRRPPQRLVKHDRQNMVFMVLLFSIKWLFQWNVAEREPAGTSENFKKFPVIFPVLREFDPGLFS